jgi:hypothetical protein
LLKSKRSQVKEIQSILDSLAKSDFRRRQTLGAKDEKYLIEKGLDRITEHAVDFVTKRLAPALPGRDGKQTPWRGHPVFVAQHATATCCRSCLMKWHGIEKGRPLNAEEVEYVVAVIRRWLEMRSRDRATNDDRMSGK